MHTLMASRRLVHLLACGLALAWVFATAPAAQAAATSLPNPTPTAGDRCGQSVAVGDINADGRDDVVYGCPDDDTGGVDAGSVVVYLRRPDNKGFVAGGELAGQTFTTTALVNTTPEHCGTSVAIGDVDADGRGDIVAACSGVDYDKGAAGGGFLVWLRAATNDTFLAPIQVLNPTPVAGDTCGKGGHDGALDGSLGVAVGDVSGDGRADVVIGCRHPNAQQGSEGHLHVFHSSGIGFMHVADIVDTPSEAGAGCGIAVAIGDLDGTGSRDVLAGCAFSARGKVTSAGDGVFVLGDNPGVSGNLRATTFAQLDICGWSVATLAVLGGRRAAVLGCPGAGIGNAGQVAVFTRGASGFAAAVTLTNPDIHTSDECGWSVASGDIDGDGRADVVAGCHRDDVKGVDAGSALVWFGNKAGGFTRSATLASGGFGKSSRCGASVAVGDINGDRRDDVVAGCPGFNGGRGAAWTTLSVPTAPKLALRLTNDDGMKLAACGGSLAKPCMVRGRVYLAVDGTPIARVARQQVTIRVDLMSGKSVSATGGTLVRAKLSARGMLSLSAGINLVPGTYRVQAVLPATPARSHATSAPAWVKVSAAT